MIRGAEFLEGYAIIHVALQALKCMVPIVVGSPGHTRAPRGEVYTL